MKSMIKEVTNSFKAALYQRISSPLYGTYIFSWVLYNWKIVLPLLFGSQNIDLRITEFTQSLEAINGGLRYDSVVVPMFVTGLILFLQPLMQRFLFIYAEWNKSEGLKKRDEFNSKTMLTLDQSNELRSSLQTANSFHQKVLENKDNEISEFKIISDRKDNEIKNLVNKGGEDSLTIASLNQSNEERKVKFVRLSKIFKRQRSKHLKLIAALKKYHEVEMKHKINELIQLRKEISEMKSIEADFEVAKDEHILGISEMAKQIGEIDKEKSDLQSRLEKVTMEKNSLADIALNLKNEALLNQKRLDIEKSAYLPKPIERMT